MESGLATAAGAGDELPPLKITCTTALCDKGTHCLKPKKPRGKARQTREQPSLFGEPAADLRGCCRACGERLVDMGRVQERDLSDLDYTVAALRKETIRHEYWCRPIDPKALDHARASGRDGLKQEAERRMRHKDVRSERSAIFRDGMQTPLQGNIIHYAQHALACCCRSCMEYWHGIPSERPLREEEMSYFVTLIMHYIGERLPQLSQDGEEGVRVKGRMKKGGSRAAAHSH